MSTHPKRVSGRFFGVVLAALLGGQASASEIGAVLSPQLGVSQAQAHAGAAALMDVARENLDPEQYKAVLDRVPGLSGVGGVLGPIEPQASPMAGLIGQIESHAGNQQVSASQLMRLFEYFQGIGLPPEMITRYGTLLLDYVNRVGGGDTAFLLRSALPL